MKLHDMNRRRFLELALTASGSLALPSAGLSAIQALKGTKVIVVGAGISGLGAARALVDQGAEVVVLEAKPHIGGRLLTDYSMGAPFEYGAGWIHGPSAANPVTQLAAAVNAKTFVTDDESLAVFDSQGERIDEDRLDEIDETWEEIIERLDRELEDYDTRSLHDAIADTRRSALRDPGMRWAFSAYTEFSKGGPIEELSAVYHDDDEAFPGADVVVTTGYDKILVPLAAGVDVRLSNAVTAIDYGGDGVVVRTQSEEFKGDYVVCSVPLGVLKAGSLTFGPSLPKEFRSNIDGLGFGSVTKIALEFDSVFWDEDTQYFGVITEDKGRWNYWLNYRTFSQQNILLGLSIGAYALVADQMTDEQMTSDALKVLRTVWEDAVGEPTRVKTTHWSTDPYALGAYTYPRPGSRPSQFDGLAEPIEDRLFLCGEHTLFDYAGTAHGAYMSGLRAAELLVEEVG